MSSTIRVAIIGGGLAGASLIHALVKYPHLDVHIFESAAEFKEAGMAIGVARNAQAALDLIGPTAAQCLKRAGAVPMRAVRFMLAYGEEAGKVIDELDDAGQEKRLTSIVHRANFLQELLAGIPKNRMHASKKLLKIDGNGPVTIHFTDGTTHECDIVIGADGIHSVVRKLVLGEDDPAASPQNSGAWCVMTLQPFEKAQSILGKDSVDVEDAREYGWAGKNAFLMHNILSGGNEVQLTIASNDREATTGSDEWQRDIRVDEIKELYQDWPAHLSKAVNELICDQPKLEAFYLWDHPKASTYVSGPICITGDAAHSTTPWQGSGGGMSIEDSLILSSLLGRAKTPSEALTALEVYDQVRRPRTQRIVESSRVTGAMVTRSDELDPETLKAFMSRWDFILDIDMERHRDEAIALMDAKVKREEVI
ncbi:hypothetical protein O1611_g3176 [Lasiodiplodia mahajangana]|uniref:Uncharacterized protein n=1 Tax=Lasiodiplodia mahajangana TaxID=1108764 RepID=A0ACC2JT57_9PEZI|nr:hypothetical protein O1611_g3176 [Lasiodiplodia mahajangana]